MEHLASCHPRYREPIDHILLGAGAENYMFQDLKLRTTIPKKQNGMREEEMLSDHCPIGVIMKLK